MYAHHFPFHARMPLGRVIGRNLERVAAVIGQNLSLLWLVLRAHLNGFGVVLAVVVGRDLGLVAVVVLGAAGCQLRRRWLHLQIKCVSNRNV